MEVQDPVDVQELPSWKGNSRVSSSYKKKIMPNW